MAKLSSSSNVTLSNIRIRAKLSSSSNVTLSNIRIRPKWELRFYNGAWELRRSRKMRAKKWQRSKRQQHKAALREWRIETGRQLPNPIQVIPHWNFVSANRAAYLAEKAARYAATQTKNAAVRDEKGRFKKKA